LTDVPEAQVGDDVVIVGRQGGDEIRPEDVIEHHDISIHAELALAVRDSVQRIYV
jgi:alanine racemase